MNRFAFAATVGALGLGLAACNVNKKDDAAVTENNVAAEASFGDAVGDTSAPPTTEVNFPAGARIAEENGVTFRIDPDGTRVQLDPSGSRILIDNGVRYRVDPGGTRVRIGDDGAAIDVNAGGISATVPVGGDTSVTVNTR